MHQIKGTSINSMDERAPGLAEGVEQLHISMVMEFTPTESSRESCMLDIHIQINKGGKHIR
jgi:hypothetical protein